MSAAPITVVVPTYKAAGFLARTLDSVTAQTRPPAEVVVADDCSPDDTAGVAEGWGRAAPFPVRVLRLARNTGGPAGPLNAGIRAARGDLIATLDHDDLMEPDKLERQAAVLTAHPDLGLVFHRSTVLGQPSDWLDQFVTGIAGPFLDAARQAPLGGSAYRIDRRAAYAGLLLGNFALTCSNIMFPRQVWRAVGGLSSRYRISCDFELMQKVAARWDVGFLDATLVRWHRHDAALSNVAAHRAVTESWNLMYDFRPGLLDPTDRQSLLDQRLDYDDQVFGIAYRLRESGRPAAALSLYLRLLARRPSWRVALGSVKAAARILLPTVAQPA